MAVKSIVFLLLACSLLLSFPTASAHKKDVSVFDIISSSKVHTILEAAVIAGKLDGALKDPNFVGTVFAPTDAAFKSFFYKSGLKAEAILKNPFGLLTALLTYHVSATVVRSKAIPKLPHTAKVTTLSNKTLTAYKTVTGCIIVAGDSTAARVIKADIKAKKAVVHVVDKVILQSGEEDFPGCSSPAAVLKRIGLTSLLAAATRAGLADELSNTTFRGTILAPSNKAFASLLKALKVPLSKVPKKTLANVLKYHLIPSPVLSKNVKNKARVHTRLTGRTLVSRVTRSGTIYFKGAKNRAKVTSADFLACRLVIHIIDTVLLP